VAGLIDFAVAHARRDARARQHLVARPASSATCSTHCDATTLITIARFAGQDYLGMLAELGGPGSARPAQARASRRGRREPRRPADRRSTRLGPRRRRHRRRARLPRSEPSGPTDVAYILYTSGTTSTPKGVQLAHGGLVENMWNIGERQHLTAADRMWMGISLFWSFGCANALLAVMTHGGTIVLQESMEPGAAARADRARAVLGLLRHAEHRAGPQRASGSAAARSLVAPHRLPRSGRRRRCRWSWISACARSATSTASPRPTATAASPTRTTRPTCAAPPSDFRCRAWRSASSIAETRRPLPTGEVGEVLVRGYLTPGYYKDRRRTPAAFDAEGFLITGDLGAIGDDGRLRFRGRIKEMVKTGGINVAPLEVEEVLLGHPGRRAGLRRRASGPAKGRDPRRRVVLHDGHDAAPETLRASARQALAAFKVPQEFRVMRRDELPVTATGKVQKFSSPRCSPGSATRRAPDAILPNDWRRNVWALTLTVFISFVGFQFFSPFLPLYIRELGVTDPAKIALVVRPAGRGHARDVRDPVAGLRAGSPIASAAR
jgi:fatty-acyl-CoA synthase